MAETTPKGTFSVTLPVGSGSVTVSGSLYPDEIAGQPQDAFLIAAILESVANRVRRYAGPAVRPELLEAE